MRINLPVLILTASALLCPAAETPSATNASPSAQKPHQSKLTHVSLIDEDSDAGSREWRKNYARTLLAEIEPLYDAIPNLSPDQEEWLRKERERWSKLEDKDAKNKAIRDLIESKENELEKAKWGLGQLVKDLKYLTGDDPVELTLWSEVSWWLTDQFIFECLASLERSGVVKLPTFSRFRRGSKVIERDEWTQGTNFEGRNILERIVIPQLRKLETKASLHDLDNQKKP